MSLNMQHFVSGTTIQCQSYDVFKLVSELDSGIVVLKPIKLCNVTKLSFLVS